MKTKLVNRYYCDFCRKANCCAPSIARHERGCTNNPARVCKMCEAAELKQASIEDLIAAANADLAPLLEEFDALAGEGWSQFEELLERKVAITKLREVANNCPACILAGIRQAKTDHTHQFDFHWQTEHAAFWKKLNAESQLEEIHG